MGPWGQEPQTFFWASKHGDIGGHGARSHGAMEAWVHGGHGGRGPWRAGGAREGRSNQSAPSGRACAGAQSHLIGSRGIAGLGGGGGGGVVRGRVAMDGSQHGGLEGSIKSSGSSLTPPSAGVGGYMSIQSLYIIKTHIHMYVYIYIHMYIGNAECLCSAGNH